MDSPGLKFKFEANGLVTPVGQAVKKLAAVVSVAVIFITTAVTPEAGTPPRPVTRKSNTPPGPRAPDSPSPDRVSKIRLGVSGVRSPAHGASPCSRLSN